MITWLHLWFIMTNRTVLSYERVDDPQIIINQIGIRFKIIMPCLIFVEFACNFGPQVAHFVTMDLYWLVFCNINRSLEDLEEWVTLFAPELIHSHCVKLPQH